MGSSAVFTLAANFQNSPTKKTKFPVMQSFNFEHEIFITAIKVSFFKNKKSRVESRYPVNSHIVLSAKLDIDDPHEAIYSQWIAFHCTVAAKNTCKNSCSIIREVVGKMFTVYSLSSKELMHSCDPATWYPPCACVRSLNTNFKGFLFIFGRVLHSILVWTLLSGNVTSD